MHKFPPRFLTLCFLLPACSDGSKPAVDLKGAPSAKAAASTSVAATTTTPPQPVKSAAPVASSKPKEFQCRVKQQGKSVYSGACSFAPEGGNGSFAIAPIGKANIAEANPITVSITEKDVAEVRGLTTAGINSRWGEAKRSTSDKACWVGSDFEICVYAGAAPKESPSTVDSTASKAVAQKHGGEYWAVYVAKGVKQDEPAVKALVETLTKRGLELGSTMGFGSLGCDVGAAAALKEKDDTNALAVYFSSETDAKAFSLTLKPPALGVVKIKAMCRD